MFNYSFGVDFWSNLGMSLVGLVGGAMMGIGLLNRKFKDMRITQEKEITIKATTGVSDTKHHHIHEMLISLRLHLNADRAQIGQFHNGGKFLEGAPMKKFSVSYESCNRGVSMEYPYLQGVLTTIFDDMINFVREEDAKVRTTESLPQDSPLHVYNDFKNIEAFAVLPIRKNDLYMGFIRLEWNDKNNIPSDPQDCKIIFEQYRSFIELEMVREGS